MFCMLLFCVLLTVCIQGAEGGDVVKEGEEKKSRRKTKSAAGLDVGKPSSNRLDNLSLKVSSMHMHHSIC